MSPHLRGRGVLLRTRITLVVAGVAAAAALVGGAVSIPLARSAATEGARQGLADQVAVLAQVGVPDAAALHHAASADAGAVFAIVADPPAGPAVGAAAPLITPAVRRAWSSDPTVSLIVRSGGEPVYIESRATGSGAIVVGALPAGSIEPQLGQITVRTLAAITIALAVAILAGWFLARWVAAPLAGTARAAGRLARGERGVPVPGGGPAETRQLAAALTGLDAALAASEARQREFLLSVSHELRTPLAALRGYAEALADGLIAGEAVPEVGRTLAAETDRLDLFVSDLLALARLEADDFRLEPADADVAVILREAVDAWEGRAATLGIRLEPQLAGSRLHTDPRRLRQVIDGLVENALRATPEGGSITVRSRTDAHVVIVEVADSGPGLAKEDLGVAFERGILHARYRETRPVGTGLGLSIAARLVGRLSGTLTARNVEGGGAVFTVSLPVRGDAWPNGTSPAADERGTGV